MSSTTINTFPPFQSMNSPRGIALALIVLLHIGFFLVLSSGMGARIVEVFRPPAVVVIPTELEPVQPEKKVIPERVHLVADRVTIPAPTLPPIAGPDEPTVIRQEANPTATDNDEATGQGPVISAPEIDPRAGLSDPLYPAAAIRAGHTGTVLISIYVLENGRVGEVRLDQSSGHKRLDDSAMREARRWRLKPGLRDGVPVAMWKQLPVTFRLQGTQF